MNLKKGIVHAVWILSLLFLCGLVIISFPLHINADTPLKLSYNPPNNNNLELQKIGFFEAGYDPPSKEQIQYGTSFPKSSTRYVWAEITCKNLLYEINSHTHQVLWKYFNPDGSLRGEINAEFHVKSEWYTSWLPRGWGWNEPGNWPPGTYKVEIWIDNEKEGTDYFTIVDDITKKTITYLSMQFFEGGNTAPEQSYRTYTTNFSKATTRSIYTEIHATNLLYEIQNHVPNFLLKYYNPDNTIMGEIENDVEISKDWESTYIWNGWGWDEPGNWSPGTYRVEVWIHGNKMDEKYFTIFEEKQKNGLRVLIDQPLFGYRVFGPSEWTAITDEEQIGYSITRESPSCDIFFFNGDMIDTDSITEEMLDVYFDEFKSEIPSATLVVKKVESFKGKPSGWLESTDIIDGTGFRQRHYLFSLNKKLLAIAIMGFEENWQETIPYWKEIMNNIEFTE